MAQSSSNDFRADEDYKMEIDAISVRIKLQQPLPTVVIEVHGKISTPKMQNIYQLCTAIRRMFMSKTINSPLAPQNLQHILHLTFLTSLFVSADGCKCALHDLRHQLHQFYTTKYSHTIVTKCTATITAAVTS